MCACVCVRTCVCVCMHVLANVHVLSLCVFTCILIEFYAGITCEICAVNKMATWKIPSLFLPFSPSMTHPMHKRFF